MNHCGTQMLETSKLVLRKFTAEDGEAIYKNWASDAEVTKYLTWPTHSTNAVSKMIAEAWANGYTDEKFYQWAIVLKENGDEPIGSISAVHVDDDVAAVEIGYCIGRTWWHRGITAEALQAVMDFFFDVVGANRVEARHDSRNPNSGKVMQKCGMKYEGTLRSNFRNNQGLCDSVYYALLKEER